MVEKKELVKAAAVAAVHAKPQPKVVDIYSYDDLVNAYQSFNVPKEVVMAALTYNAITRTDMETARKVIDIFMRRMIL